MHAMFTAATIVLAGVCAPSAQAAAHQPEQRAEHRADAPPAREAPAAAQTVPMRVRIGTLASLDFDEPVIFRSQDRFVRLGDKPHVGQGNHFQQPLLWHGFRSTIASVPLFAEQLLDPNHAVRELGTLRAGVGTLEPSLVVRDLVNGTFGIGVPGYSFALHVQAMVLRSTPSGALIRVRIGDEHKGLPVLYHAGGVNGLQWTDSATLMVPRGGSLAVQTNHTPRLDNPPNGAPAGRPNINPNPAQPNRFPTTSLLVIEPDWAKIPVTAPAPAGRFTVTTLLIEPLPTARLGSRTTPETKLRDELAKLALVSTYRLADAASASVHAAISAWIQQPPAGVRVISNRSVTLDDMGLFEQIVDTSTDDGWYKGSAYCAIDVLTHPEGAAITVSNAMVEHRAVWEPGKTGSSLLLISPASGPGDAPRFALTLVSREEELAGLPDAAAPHLDVAGVSRIAIELARFSIQSLVESKLLSLRNQSFVAAPAQGR